MALQEKLTAETEVSSELRVEIKTLNERIQELEDELANRPEVKDDSSSSSSEKEDHSGELEEWKKKYQEKCAAFESMEAEYSTYKRRTTSQIDELQISVTNLEKRNAELKYLLNKHNIEAPDSPDKIGQ